MYVQDVSEKSLIFTMTVHPSMCLQSNTISWIINPS